MQIDGFLAQFHNLLRANARAVTITAAEAGDILRRSALPEVQTLGYPKLRDALSEMEKLGWLQLVRTEKGALAITLASQEQLSLPALSSEPPKHQRPDVWTAFVNVGIEGCRLFNVVTGEVLIGLSEEEIPESTDWIRIDPITTDVQVEWAKEFLEQHSVPEGAVSPHVDVFPRDFWRSLKAHDEDLAKEWNRERSRRVGEYISEWCSRHNVPKQLLGRSTVAFGKPALPQEPSSPQREIVLRALALMNDDDLLDLPIRAKYLLMAMGERK